MSPIYAKPGKACGIYLILPVFILSFLVVNAQITKFPLNAQLYPRNPSTNTATVTVEGTMSYSTGYTQVRLKRSRNGYYQKTITANLTYVNGVASYTILDELPAELANYTYTLYGYKSWKETWLKAAYNVVAGDVYLVQGQSNAVANVRGSLTTENDANSSSNSPYRNYVRVWGSGSSTASYTKSWFVAMGNSYYDVNGNTGQWALRMASRIAESQRIPICILNGGYPGAAIGYFLRNDFNPYDGGTNYGRLLNRSVEAGVRERVRGILWYQGESDASGSLNPNQLSTSQYKTNFNSLYSDWKEDYPGLEHILIFQTRFGCGMYSRDGALQIQEAHRQLSNEHSDISLISTSNTNNYSDDCHYSFVEGYKKMGDWAYEMVQRVIYHVNNGVNTPQPKKAVVSRVTSEGVASQIALVLSDPNTTYSSMGNLAADFRMEGGSFSIYSHYISNDSLFFNVSRNSGSNALKPSGLSYLSHQGTASPVIYNSKGLGLAYFLNIVVEDADGSTPPPPPPPPPSGCTDNYEPNNSGGASVQIQPNTTINALIDVSPDVDWFNVRTNSTGNYIKFSLFNLPADYELYVYRSNWTLLGSSTNSGTTPEEIIDNSGSSNALYYIGITRKAGNFNAELCYSLKTELSTTEWATGTSINPGLTAAPMETLAKTEFNTIIPSGISIYPNPTRDNISVRYSTEVPGPVSIRVVNLSGRQVLVEQRTATKGENIYTLKLDKIQTGLYLIQVIGKNSLVTEKINIIR